MGDEIVDDWVVSTESRCGTSEADARGNCRGTCATTSDCNVQEGQLCWNVHPNYCGSKPEPVVTCSNPAWGTRCGKSELLARELCGVSCQWAGECTGEGEDCFP